MSSRSAAVLAQDVLARAAGTRIALESARRRGRMYLADPATAKSHRVIVEMVALLESAPEPVHQVRGPDDRPLSCEGCGATEGVNIDVNLGFAVCTNCATELQGAAL